MGASQCFLLVLVVASLVLIEARESRFFSKVTRPDPEPETHETLSSVEARVGRGGYGGLVDKELETYEYPPTTGNPTKSRTREVGFGELGENAGGYRYEGVGEEDDGHESYYESVGEREGGGERQGMSDTRFLEKGRYFYDVSSSSSSNSNEDGGERYYGKESGKYSSGYGSRNKFPRYEFDSMEEYEKYEEGRSHQAP